MSYRDETPETCTICNHGESLGGCKCVRDHLAEVQEFKEAAWEMDANRQSEINFLKQETTRLKDIIVRQVEVANQKEEEIRLLKLKIEVSQNR